LSAAFRDSSESIVVDGVIKGVPLPADLFASGNPAETDGVAAS
jgi:hypothetical protein